MPATNTETETPADAPEPETTEPPEPVQPAEAAPDEGRTIELHTEAGALTLRPNQTELDTYQKAALVAIGIDTQADPLVIPHIRPFMHMCQRRGLDPFLREAYLIGRGMGANRKYTMQTGIDGYRKMAAATGRFIRVKETLWTGSDDDDRSYVAVDDGKGGIIMRRRWYDQWPASRGYPGAAKVTIEHYDEFGNVVETDAVADWSMYAPFTDEWEWHPTERGKKVYKTNPDGSRVQTLNDMWKKGYAHMLAKCAEALADRKAFPAKLSGVYTHEEMHRADQQERDRVEAEVRAARQKAYADQHKPTTSLAKVEPPADPEAPAGPIPIRDVVGEVVPEGPQADQDGPVADQGAPKPDQEAPQPDQGGLLAELGFQSEVLDHAVTKLAARAMRALRKNPEEFTAEELLAVVVPLRPATLKRLQELDRTDEADLYAEAPPTGAFDLSLLVVDGEVEGEVDPEEDHGYVADGDVCLYCGLPEDVGPHPE